MILNIQSITKTDVERVYSGRQGCMCGCRGTYSTNPAQVTRVLNRLKNDPRAVLSDGWGGGPILHINDKLVDRNERNYVVYLKKGN